MRNKAENRILILSSLLAFAASPAIAHAEKCTFNLDPNSVQVGWTAFKTTQKVGVNASFKKFKLHGPTKNKSLAHLLEHLKISIDPTSIDTGNPARDKTIEESFFGQVKKSISGSIKSVSEKDQTLTLALNFNGQTKDVPMHYEVTNTNTYKATGSFDVLDFGAQTALKSLNEKCYDLHKGADGVSKTWSEVNLSLTGKIDKNCK